MQSIKPNPHISYISDWPGISREEKRAGFLLPCVARAHEAIEFESIALLASQTEKAICVVFENQQLMVLDKPSGLLSVPGKGPDKADSLSSRVQALKGKEWLSVHRLDQATSGLMVMAKGVEMHRALSMAFAHQTIRKSYLAIVSGHIDVRHEWVTIDLPIHAHWPDRPKRSVHTLGKPSQTRYRALANSQQCSFLEIQPLSGRTHQIRVHLQAIGHPIWGDQLYASQEVAQASPRLLLHAHSISLTDPRTQETLNIQSPLQHSPDTPTPITHNIQSQEGLRTAPWLELLCALRWDALVPLSLIGKS
jgi:tRNA pseudouridine32 synthase/23S rRNA pseudouridine746 synthase